MCPPCSHPPKEIGLSYTISSERISHVCFLVGSQLFGEWDTGGIEKYRQTKDNSLGWAFGFSTLPKVRCLAIFFSSSRSCVLKENSHINELSFPQLPLPCRSWPSIPFITLSCGGHMLTRKQNDLVCCQQSHQCWHQS